MNLRRLFAIALLTVAVVVPPAFAKDAKDKEAPKPKTGMSRLAATPPTEYIHMAVPADYDPKKFYPLMFLLHSLSDDEANSKPEIFMAPWAEILLKRGWIIAGPKSPIYDNETSAGPLADVLKKAGVNATRITVHSDKGHDSFLLEPHLYRPFLRAVLQR